MNLTKKYINDIVYQVIGASIEVHKALGPGLLESVYHKCLKHELAIRNISFESEVIIPINYKKLEVNANLRLDLLVEGILPVELKATDKMASVFDAQILSYMKLLCVPKGLMINFHVNNIFKDGQKTFVNKLYIDLDDE